MSIPMSVFTQGKDIIEKLKTRDHYSVGNCFEEIILQNPELFKNGKI